jgi:hypothetical protein
VALTVVATGNEYEKKSLSLLGILFGWSEITIFMFVFIVEIFFCLLKQQNDSTLHCTRATPSQVSLISVENFKVFFFIASFKRSQKL